MPYEGHPVKDIWGRGANVSDSATRNADGQGRSLIITEGQTAIAVIGLVAIAAIVALHFLSRPQLLPADARLLDPAACGRCGTVVAVRRSAHSVPVYFVEVKMPDGSILTVRQPADGLSIGDVVEVRGDALTPRDIF